MLVLSITEAMADPEIIFRVGILSLRFEKGCGVVNHDIRDIVSKRKGSKFQAPPLPGSTHRKDLCSSIPVILCIFHQDHCCVLHSIIGWECVLGEWSRIEGHPCDPNPNDPLAQVTSTSLFNDKGKLNPTITILGMYV